MFVLVFVFGGLFASISLAAVHNTSVVITPASALIEENLTYTYTITNDALSTAKIGSAEIQLPTGFGTPSVSISSTSPHRTWVLGSSSGYVSGFNSATGKIGIQADGGPSELDASEFVAIQVTTTAPSSQNSYEWTVSPWANLGFSGTLFSLTSSQPTVNVTTPIVIPPTPTVKFIIKNGDIAIYNNNSLSLPAPGTTSISDTSTTPTSHTIDARSVLAVLKNIDDLSADFSISNLQYYPPFNPEVEPLGSFYLKCLLPSGGSDLCDNWLFTVNNLYPPAIEKSILSGGETIYVYFGPQNKIILSSSTINTNDTLTVTTQKYDYENNTWSVRNGITVGLTQPNPSDPFSPTEIQIKEVDENGQAVFSGIPVGSYNVGIQQDYYFPTESLTVTNPPSGGGTGGSYIPPTFDVQKALAYLKGTQNADGSFGNSLLYTDWAGITFGAMNVTDTAKDKLLTYFNSHNTLSSLLTDNERYAMALLALKQNPYAFGGVNYIKAITDSFNGTQFGDVNLINDDIFALIPLKNSGYTATDEMIKKDVAFLISKQKTDGSWEESVDITSATIQALKSFETIAGVTESITKAVSYIVNKQNNDGGWDSVYSTSWAMQAMGALSASWTKGAYTPNNYLGIQQNADGAVLPSSEILTNRIWATSYAIVGGSLRPWSTIMQTVSKPTEALTQNNQNANISNPVKKTTLISKIQKTALASESLQIPQVTPDALTASAINTENTSTPNNTTPFILGFLSGVAVLYLLYLLKKFLVK